MLLTTGDKGDLKKIRHFSVIHRHVANLALSTMSPSQTLVIGSILLAYNQQMYMVWRSGNV